jgi:hypothetical protein
MARLFQETEHQDSADEVVCVGYFNTCETAPELQLFDDYYLAASRLLDDDAPGWAAYWASRHCVELGLKIGSGVWENQHNLNALLEALPVGHPAVAGTEEGRDFRSYVSEISRLDPKGDMGRYPKRLNGDPSFDGWCHSSKAELQRLIALAFQFFREPTLGDHGGAESPGGPERSARPTATKSANPQSDSRYVMQSALPASG